MLALTNNPYTAQLLPLVTTTADPLLVLLNYGGLGIIALLFITGRVSSKPEVDYLRRQLERQDALIDDLRVQLTDRTIPALARAQQVIAEYPQTATAPVDPALRQTLEALVDRVERLAADDGRPG